MSANFRNWQTLSRRLRMISPNGFNLYLLELHLGNSNSSNNNHSNRSSGSNSKKKQDLYIIVIVIACRQGSKYIVLAVSPLVKR